ncbi:MAG TPA: amino acid adenylation domain-containing protein [Verrucomicrobiae bacterium]|nr:amino acid adenylation domain-containing protein [Verrucomicrobiae bacterium]
MITGLKSNAPGGAQARRALLEQRLRKAAGPARPSALSFAQQRLWFLDQLEPNSPLYNVASVARVQGKIHARALEQAINAIIARHEALRTRFVCPDESPVQVVDARLWIPLKTIDLMRLAPAERESEAERLTHEEIHLPFDLGAGPLLRPTLLHLTPDEHRLVLVIHHIVADEWSLKVLFRELAAFYEGFIENRPNQLPELPIQYADYAAWQRDWLRGDVLEKQIGFWKQQLGGEPPATELPTDFPRPQTPAFHGGNQARVFSQDLAVRLSQFAAQHEATLFMVLLAALKTLLHRYTRQEDIIVASPIAGRNRVETEGLIGFFVNTLPLRTRLNGDPAFEELLARVRQVTVGAYAHQDLPFERLVEELQPERSLSHLPFTKVMFVIQNDVLQQINLPGAQLQFVENEADTAKFDLTLLVQERARGLVARAEYNCDLFRGESIERLLQHFETLLEGIVDAPGRRLSQLPILSAAETKQMLSDWNSNAREYPRDKCVHELFEAQAQRHPDTIAILFGQASITYGELNARANQLAHYLKGLNVGPDVPVGICLRRSVDMIIGLLGILKAGGVYVPLDPAYPKDRLAFMLEDTQAGVLLTQQTLLAQMPQNAVKLISLDGDWELIARESKLNPANVANPLNLAYIMYTSGSTGRPKGVAVPHRAINRLVLNTNFIQIDATDRIAQVSNMSFDAATFEIWGALLNGGQLIGITRDVALFPAAFSRELSQQGITAMFLTSALFNQLAAEVPRAFAGLRTLIAGGDALDPKWVRVVLKQGPPARLVNGYGPTENTTFTCCHLIEALDEEALNVPIGRPIANTQVYILDPHLNPAPIGAPGELYAGGDGLARGYWNQPELTAEKFIPNPFDPSGASRLYRTGDLARYRPDGTIEFMGRIDQQVKIRGFRVEPGEIETVLNQHPRVRECVVVVRGEGAAAKRLIAYLVPSGEPVPNASQLRAFVQEKLPDYMVPSAFIPLETLPLTPNGKVDRKALPALNQERPELERQYVAPRDEVERQLAAIWERALGMRPIGIQDKFFDLGGHSLLAVRVIAQIEKNLGKKLRLATIFQAPTIEQLAAIVREEIKESTIAASTSLVEIQPQGSRPPLFLVHGAGGGMFWGYVNLSHHLGADQPVYGFKSRGLDGRQELTSIRAMASTYVADLRSLQPHGPYFLGGYCFGGNVAFEMACQLSKQGQKVAFLALLNCSPPNSRYTRTQWTPLWVGRFLRNLLYYANYARQWSPAQRREFFRWKWSLVRKRLTHHVGSAPGPLSSVGAGDLVDLSSYPEEQRQVWEAHIQALLQFHPQPFDGRVHLFRSPGHPFWCSFDADYGWSDLARDGVNITIIPGAHEKILEEPCVQILARGLDKLLNEAQAAAESSHVEPAGGGLEPVAGQPNNHSLQNRMQTTNDPREQVRGAFQEGLQPGAQRNAIAGVVENHAIGLGLDDGFESTYPVLFLAQAQRAPSAIAVRFEGAELTYAELNTRANRLAHYLQHLGVGPEVLVGVCLERSLDLMVVLLAILKAGGAYLPLDPAYPSERLAYMLSDSRAPLVLTTRRLLSRLPQGSVQSLCLDDQEAIEGIRGSSGSQPNSSPSARDLAYVIYTSGSTGAPKGVQIAHRALLNHNLAITRAFSLKRTDRVLQFTPLSFDISVEEIFPTWLRGAALVLRPEQSISSSERFLDFIEDERLTVLNLPTSYWHELVDFLQTSERPLPESVRLMIIGGEKASNEAYKRWKQCVGGRVALMNGYGATEATVTSTLYLARGDEESLPIGRPIANTHALILDEQLKPAPQGAEGELFLGGAGLARGYLDRPELTAQKFIANPFPKEIDSDRLYRTGDLARLLPDGNLEFLGRLDEQVKIRGFRVELAEIESALLGHPDVKEAVVVAREDMPGKKRLVAYLVARSTPGPRVNELAHFLKQKLPGYMVPAAFISLSALPLTPAGKVDRRGLPLPSNARPDIEQEFIAPRTPLEERLAGIWGDVLEINSIGVEDSFFDLGGHSLLAMQIISRIRDTFHEDVSLADLFAHPTIGTLATHLMQSDTLQGAWASACLEQTTRRRLSSRQQRLWVLEQFQSRLSPFNRPLLLRLCGPLDRRALEQSITELARRHEGLRAIFASDNGEPVQYVCNPDEIALQVIDFSTLDGNERERACLARAQQETRRPYIMAQPVLRPLLFRLNPTEHWLLLALHEIVADDRAERVVFEELTALYEGFASQNPISLPPPLPYDEAAAQADSSPCETEDMEYWRTQLAGAPEHIDLPTDRPRPSEHNGEGARLKISLSPRLTSAIEQLSRERCCPIFTTLLAGFATMLHRYTGSSDMVIGSTNPGQPARGSGIANFENPIALRCNLSGDPRFQDLVMRLDEVVSGARAHSRLPFAALVDQLDPGRDAKYPRVFQVGFVLEEQSLPQRIAGSLRFTPLQIDNHTAKLDLALRLAKTPEGFSGWIEYSTALFEHARMARLVKHFLALLEGAVFSPETKLSALPLLPQEEKKQVLIDWTRTEQDYPRNKTIATLFCEQAARTPDAEALVSGNQRWSYRRLYNEAVQIALDLQQRGVQPESLVGICLQRTPEMVAALLGTLLAGAAYVPLDPGYPVDRLSFIVQHARLSVLIAQQPLLDLVPKGDAQLFCVEARQDEAQKDTTLQPMLKAPRRASQSSSLAYVIYTSGSTGRPKGVAIEHRSVSAFIHWAKGFFRPEDLSGVLASTSICFDLSVFELFVPLCCGGKVLLVDNALGLAALPAADEVRLINTVPSAMRELLRLKAVPPSVRVINLAGEPLATSLVDRIYRETRVQKVYDLYGPTETTTYSTCALRLPGARASIGRPLPNEQVYLLDAQLQPAPIGIAAELYIGGEGLARGYLYRDDLTRERFVPHPFRPGARLYRTGDLARWRSDGNLEYLGRIDYQVKVRGFRVELGEIEAVLRAHSSVRETVVVAREDHPGDKRLVAYVVAADAKTLSAQDLRQAAIAKLPEYMVPSAFVFLDALPLTPNGKVDRKALPPPGEEQRVGGFIAPRTPIEEQLAAIWREVLHINQVGLQDNFFDLGGHSLLATQVISRINELFKINLPLLALFSAPTIAQLSAGLEAGQWTDHAAPILPLQAVTRRASHPVSFVQERLWFLNELQPGGHAYNVPTVLRLKGHLDRKALAKALDHIGQRHEALRASFHYANGELTQVIARKFQFDSQDVDLGNAPAEEKEKRAREWALGEARRAFDLAAGPLTRVSVARLEDCEHLLAVVMHHTVSDGWSLAIFFRELQALYDAFAAGKPAPPLPKLSIQYIDFVHWQRQWMRGPVLERELNYWKQKLDGASPAVELPADFAASEQPVMEALRRTVTIEPRLVQAMKSLAQQQGNTPFMVLFAGLVMTLHKWTAQRDLVIGTVVAGRTRRELEDIIGCFMNFLPLRAQIQGGETAEEILARARETALEAQAHQDCPFEKIVEAVNPQRGLNRNPLYNVGLLVQNFPNQLFPSEKLEAASLPVELDAALLDLRFEAEHTPVGLCLHCEYRADLFAPGTIDQLLASCLDALRFIAEQPKARLAEFHASPALETQAEACRSGKARRTIAITATFTAELLAEPLGYWLKELDLPAIVEFAPYNQVFQQLLDPCSLLAANENGLNVVLLWLEDWQRRAGVPGQERAQGPDENLARSVQEFSAALKAAASRTSTPFLVCLCPPSPATLADPVQSKVLAREEAALVAGLEGSAGVYVLSSADIGRWYPVKEYYDPSGDELGHVPFTPLFFTGLATAIGRKYHSLQRAPGKVIVLDCDQTLWSGVCGEDGPHGIQLDPPWKALQEFMRAQQEAGMLLCLCSKNNEADVLEVFNQRLDMPLRREHFISWRLNWQPKSENLRSLAQELQLGLDSFIFLDDNPLECAEVEANCPEVLVLQLPTEPRQIPDFLNHCWIFDHLKLTAEDKRRAQLYRQNQQREQLRVQSPSLLDFLSRLELKLDIHPMRVEELSRVAQLTQRTNQFNCNPARLTESDLQQRLSSSEVFAVQVSDRFGDYGLAGVLLCQWRTDLLQVDWFLLSCRVLGRGVEHRMLSWLGERARERSAKWVDLHFVKTARNKPAFDFLESVGADFKQALNGGYVFRFPAGFAAEVAFQPSVANVTLSAQSAAPIPASGGGSAQNQGRKFTQCRSIALEANEAAKIQQRIESRRVLRTVKQMDYAAPQTEIERRLCGLWQDLLHVTRVGLKDNFFELGGHSLLAVRLFAEIEKLTGRKFPLVTLFQAPTLGQLARVLSQAQGPACGSLLVPIQPKGAKPPLFLVHGAGGDVLWGYANLAAYTPADQPIYGIKSRGQSGLDEPATIGEMAQHYLQAVREFQPQGPYYLGGYCFGGNVAYEMARQLRAAGQSVALVLLIDSSPANAGYETVAWWRPGFWSRFARNFIYWLHDFAQLQPAERSGFILRKFRALGRKLKRRIQGEKGPGPVDLEEVIDPERIPDNELRLWKVHLQALITHVDQSYPGGVSLFRTRGQPLFCSLEEDFCWGKLVQGEVGVTFIPGSHENIFMEPNVQALARLFKTALAEAQGAPGEEGKPELKTAEIS